jgi:hypothetical protein
VVPAGTASAVGAAYDATVTFAVYAQPSAAAAQAIAHDPSIDIVADIGTATATAQAYNVTFFGGYPLPDDVFATVSVGDYLVGGVIPAEYLEAQVAARTISASVTPTGRLTGYVVVIDELEAEVAA